MPDTPIKRRDLDLALEPIIKDIISLKEDARLRTTESQEMRLQIARLDGKFDEGTKAIRDQVKDQGERFEKAGNEIKAIINENNISTQKLITDTAREQNEVTDKIVDVLGIDGHADNAFELKTDLKTVRAARLQKAADIKTVRERIINWGIGIIGGIFLLGTGAMITLKFAH